MRRESNTYFLSTFGPGGQVGNFCIPYFFVWPRKKIYAHRIHRIHRRMGTSSEQLVNELLQNMMNMSAGTSRNAGTSHPRPNASNRQAVRPRITLHNVLSGRAPAALINQTLVVHQSSSNKKRRNRPNSEPGALMLVPNQVLEYEMRPQKKPRRFNHASKMRQIAANQRRRGTQLRTTPYQRRQSLNGGIPQLQRRHSY